VPSPSPGTTWPRPPHSWPALDLLREQGTEVTSDADTPVSLQVIQAGSLAFSRFWNKVVAGGVTVAGLTTAVGGVVTNLTHSLPDAVGAALVVGGLLVIAAGAIAIAVIVAADARSLADATIAQMNGRTAIATALIEAANQAGAATAAGDTTAISTRDALLLAVSAFPGRLRISDSTGAPTEAVVGIRNTGDEGLRLLVESGDWIPVDKVRHFQT
jgi:hypothetical protein